MTTWKDDAEEVARFFHHEGKPRSWVLIVAITLAVAVGGLFILRSLDSPAEAPTPEPTVTVSAEPVAEDPPLGAVIQSAIEADWRRAATPGCVESFTTGVPRGVSEPDFVRAIENALSIDGLAVSSNEQVVTVARTTEVGTSVATITVRNTATVVCVN